MNMYEFMQNAFFFLVGMGCLCFALIMVFVTIKVIYKNMKGD